MLPMRLGPGDLLEYNARYRVLICRECQYAIQKSAMPSHLLRHKIYRGERQQLLSAIAQLDVSEPEDVIMPDASSPPIESLPVISGFRCTVTGCGNLCASSKRMKRHQSEAHQNLQSAPFARPAKLQTFFRGTKLRYFEVTCELTVHQAEPLPGAALGNTYEDSRTHDEKNYEELLANVGMAEKPFLPQSPSPSYNPNSLDLGILTYFHHFITNTSSTLPTVENSENREIYWQTSAIVHSLQHRWLMCGLLAISASHCASLSPGVSSKTSHRDYYVQFLAEFSAGWEGRVTVNKETETHDLAVKIGFILHCAQCAFLESSLDGFPLQSSFNMEYFMQSIPKFFSSLPNVQTGERGGILDAIEEDAFSCASRIFKRSIPANPGNTGVLSTYEDSPSMMLGHLRTLPSRMAEVFGKPENAQDFLTVLSGIAILAECCEASFATDTIEAAWRCLARWLIKVPSRFYHMLSQHSPVPLVVIGHWAAFLVKRAENLGCWFLVGCTRRILLQIIERLQGHAARSLIEDLMF